MDFEGYETRLKELSSDEDVVVEGYLTVGSIDVDGDLTTGNCINTFGEVKVSGDLTVESGGHRRR